MKNLLFLLSAILVGCSAIGPSPELHESTSGKGWEATVKAENVPNYVPWEVAIDRLIEDAKRIETVVQAHSLQVNFIYKDQSILGTIEPDIDTIFLVVERCGKRCEHIQWITE